MDGMNENENKNEILSGQNGMEGNGFVMSDGNGASMADQGGTGSNAGTGNYGTTENGFVLVQQPELRDGEQRNQETHSFYKEHKPKKNVFWKRAGVLVLVLCLMSVSGGLGYGLASLAGGGGGSNKVNLVEATGTISYQGDSVSPGVAIAKKVSPAIVSIVIKATGQSFWGQTITQQGVGSGIIISPDGYIATNNHVVEGANSITVVMADGKNYAGTVVGRDPQTDLAVVKIDGKNLPTAVLGDSTKLQVGELAIAIGTPMGTSFGGSVTQGIISGLNRQITVDDKAMNVIQTDAAINQGNSGGALVNANGEVIGINSSKLIETGTEGMGFAIPISEAKPILKELIENKQISRPQLGIQGTTISAEDAKANQIPQGVYVASVVAGSGAEKAGLQRGDIITKIDGKPIKTIEDLQSIVKKHKVGDKLGLTVFGVYNRERDVTVTLSESQN